MHSITKRNRVLSTHVWRQITRGCFIILLTSAETPAFALGGSIGSEAPSYSLFGAFFPAWMFCALIGIFGAIGARAAMVSSGLAEVLPYQLFVCASIGLIVALVAWLIWFGR